MRAAHAMYVAIFLASSASSRASADRRASDRSARLLSKLRGTTSTTVVHGQDAHGRRADTLQFQQPTHGAEQPRRALDPAVAKALAPDVIGAKVKLADQPGHAPAIERDPTWFDLPAAAPSKPFRPKVMVQPMGFPTGGGGVKFKFRY